MENRIETSTLLKLVNIYFKIDSLIYDFKRYKIKADTFVQNYLELQSNYLSLYKKELKRSFVKNFDLYQSEFSFMNIHKLIIDIESTMLDIAWCCNRFEIKIPDPEGKLKEKYKWITSDEELYQEVMKFYPKFKKLVEQMKKEI